MTQHEAALDALKTSIAELEACAGDETLILAFDNGIAVSPTDGPRPIIWSIPEAPEHKGPVPVVTNGKGERARLVTRAEAAAPHLESLKAALAQIEG